MTQSWDYEILDTLNSSKTYKLDCFDIIGYRITVKGQIIYLVLTGILHIIELFSKSYNPTIKHYKWGCWTVMLNGLILMHWSCAILHWGVFKVLSFWRTGGIQRTSIRRAKIYQFFFLPNCFNLVSILQLTAKHTFVFIVSQYLCAKSLTSFAVSDPTRSLRCSFEPQPSPADKSSWHSHHMQTFNHYIQWILLSEWELCHFFTKMFFFNLMFGL